jgi:hypothetical protein
VGIVTQEAHCCNKKTGLLPGLLSARYEAFWDFDAAAIGSFRIGLQFIDRGIQVLLVGVFLETFDALVDRGDFSAPFEPIDLAHTTSHFNFGSREGQYPAASRWGTVR